MNAGTETTQDQAAPTPQKGGCPGGEKQPCHLPDEAKDPVLQGKGCLPCKGLDETILPAMTAEGERVAGDIQFNPSRICV